MSRKTITTYDLLISCPGDVQKYIKIIKECVDEFNKSINKILNAEIKTKHWKTDSYPQSGGSAQVLLNEQFINDCDAAVAIFWTRFGTPTDKYGSGTEEEIEIMIEQKKQVFMYFLNEAIEPSAIDHTQYEKIKSFQNKYNGLYGIISNENNFRQQFKDHLGLYFTGKIREDNSINNQVIPELISSKNPTNESYTDKAIHPILNKSSQERLNSTYLTCPRCKYTGYAKYENECPKCGFVGDYD